MTPCRHYRNSYPPRSNTGVYLSTNSGSSWAVSLPLNDCDALAGSADGSKLFAANGDSGGVYFSTNSGSTWT
jgi:hypothetical protein